MSSTDYKLLTTDLFWLYFFLKRIIDIVGATIILGVFSLPSLLIALAIKLESPGPVFADTPKRVGKDGQLFKMYKFRSMIANAHDILRTDPEFKKLLEEYKSNSFKLKNDPRVTKAGKFIRKHSLDEIPQLINVLKGEMSLVGPRAYYPDELRDQQQKFPQTKEHVHEMLSVKPGVTGVWQVSGRSEINFDKRIQMDAKYAKEKSIWYDIIIILKTPAAMIIGRGAM
jgi:lipopolysaccharide/colanic/teichoic acid biosynthesis glycosyltransferase